MTGIERLRQMGADAVRGGEVGRAICDIVDQIERERACDMDTIENLRLELGEARDHSAAVSMSAYDLMPQEDRDAIAWVLENGGLESVKERLDWVVGHCSTKQQLDFDFWLSGRVMYALGFDEDMADRDEVERRLLDRLMPEGMEWPRFEDGAPVKFGDVVYDGDETWRVYYVTFDAVNPVIIGFTDEEPDRDPGTWLAVSVSDGERIKRPAPKVLDADGVPINEGEELWDIDTGAHGEVVYAHDYDGMSVKFAGVWHYPERCTHRAPVLAADGKPLREGETVWHEDGTELRVLDFLHEEDGETIVKVERVSGPTDWSEARSLSLTHERPEIDSWERLEEEARSCTCVMEAIDLVRRARALAGEA